MSYNFWKRNCQAFNTNAATTITITAAEYLFTKHTNYKFDISIKDTSNDN